MKLVVKVIEARNLPAMDLNGLSDPYVKLQLGRTKFRTKVVKKCLSPYWGDEFSFRVDDLGDELVVKVPIFRVFDAEDKSLGTAWYSLQPKSKKSKKDCGEICLNIYLPPHSSRADFPGPGKSSVDEKFESPMANSSGTSRSSSPLTEVARSEVRKSTSVEQFSSGNFAELMQLMESRDQGVEVPSNLSGGVLLDKFYVITPSELNALLFSPDSSFINDVSDVQGKTELQSGPWKFENDGSTLKRVVTYLNPATKLIKAVKATEEQSCLKAGANGFVVLTSVYTPDVPYGSSFRVELLYCITSGPELPSGEQSSHLVISWRVNFVQSVMSMMKGMIENGAKQGLKDSFDQYANCLSDKLKSVDMKDYTSTREQVLASLQAETQSDWKLAVQYFANFTVVTTIIIGLYVILHVWLAAPTATQGLEFVGLDLPDSIGEVIVCSVIVLQVQRVLDMVARFLQARIQRGSDHGIKAKGDGWLLTVALIEGSSLAAVDASGFSDPYVVFTCNGKIKTSSIIFQKLDPQWNEIFEFDAMDEPPSTLDIEVFDFDGPFDNATSLGHAEINFLRANIADLSDVWIPLQGNLAQAVQSKLHVRIFLDDNRGGNVVTKYLAKMEKEVGKKIIARSPQTNSTFQKVFGLPPEEFLINDFTCHLKRKRPMQGRLFLSARIIGFHTNLFGRKTTFYFLWEDIEDVQLASPNLSSMGSPIMVITLRKGRGQDAKHGAKTQDEEGRLKFHFQSFVSFNVAHKTIMALWKARALSPEQKVRIVEEESDAKSLESEESGAFMGIEDVNMSEVYSSSLTVPINSLMELYNGGDVEQRLMEKVGCLNYSCSPWELLNDVHQRQICYKFDKRVSSYRGEVTSTQQRSSLPDKNGWLIEEVMTLHGIPFGEYFNLHLRYQVEGISKKSNGCHIRISFGVAWLKTTRHQKRISKNISSSLQERMKMMFTGIEKELASEKIN
ncbi:hypothetical protein V2J09_012318 [Rumex salicifolius]